MHLQIHFGALLYLNLKRSKLELLSPQTSPMMKNDMIQGVQLAGYSHNFREKSACCVPCLSWWDHHHAIQWGFLPSVALSSPSQHRVINSRHAFKIILKLKVRFSCVQASLLWPIHIPEERVKNSSCKLWISSLLAVEFSGRRSRHSSGHWFWSS